MKMTERIKRNMQADKPVTLISLRLPDHVIEDLKEVAPSLGFGGLSGADSGLYLERSSQAFGGAGGAAGEGQHGGGVSQRLIARGVPEAAIQEAAAEMMAGK